jgi:hypothetical protein
VISSEVVSFFSIPIPHSSNKSLHTSHSQVFLIGLTDEIPCDWLVNCCTVMQEVLVRDEGHELWNFVVSIVE